MGTDDKLDAKGDQLKGKVKEGVGDATDDPGLELVGLGVELVVGTHVVPSLARPVVTPGCPRGRTSTAAPRAFRR